MEILNSTDFEVFTLPTKGPNDQPAFTVIVKGTFDIVPDQKAIISSEQWPILFGDEFFDPEKGGSIQYEADIAPFKPRADIALVGSVYPPLYRDVHTLDVSLKVGNVKKRIRVFGDRRWNALSTLFPATISNTKPVIKIPLIYENAFGGIAPETHQPFQDNPVGKGYFSKKDKKKLDQAPLPNLEDPDHLIKKWQDHPAPSGFGFINRTWQPRIGYLGTYDEKWRKERSPDLPYDFKYDYYNAAHLDLQVTGYLKGDETVQLTHLTFDGDLQFALSGLSPVCEITRDKILSDELSQKTGKIVNFPIKERIRLNLDTLCLIPDEEKIYQVWRGLVPVFDLSGLEIAMVRIDLG